jgi:hypothetical protein
MDEDRVIQPPLMLVIPVRDEAGDGGTQPTPASRLRAGDLCPACRGAHLDYDGLLNLACPACGYALGGCFT